LVNQRDAWASDAARGRLVFLGWGLYGSGNAEEGLARQREGLDLMTGLDGQLYLTLLDSQPADSLLAAERYSDGLAVVAQAFDTLVRTGEHSYLSRLHGRRGELLLHANGWADEAGEKELHKALAVAREQDAKAGNSAPPPASPGCGGSGDGGRKRTIFSHRFTAGSPKVSTPPT
jgi:hypothetical protein